MTSYQYADFPPIKAGEDGILSFGASKAVSSTVCGVLAIRRHRKDPTKTQPSLIGWQVIITTAWSFLRECVWKLEMVSCHSSLSTKNELPSFVAAIHPRVEGVIIVSSRFTFTSFLLFSTWMFQNQTTPTSLLFTWAHNLWRDNGEHCGPGCIILSSCSYCCRHWKCLTSLLRVRIQIKRQQFILTFENVKNLLTFCKCRWSIPRITPVFYLNFWNYCFHIGCWNDRILCFNTCCRNYTCESILAVYIWHHNYYVYMSSDGPPKRDSPFWRHWTVRFTCLKSLTCGRRVGKHILCRLVNKELYGVGKHVHWCTDFTNSAIAVHASHDVGAVNYGSRCIL